MKGGGSYVVGISSKSLCEHASLQAQHLDGCIDIGTTIAWTAPMGGRAPWDANPTKKLSKPPRFTIAFRNPAVLCSRLDFACTACKSDSSAGY